MPLSGGAPGTRASRRCDRAGRWEPGDYSHCLYTNDITGVLYTFVLVRPGRGWRPWGRGRGEAGWSHGAGGPCVLGRHGEEHGASAMSRARLLFQGFQTPQGHTWDGRATPIIFVPQYSKVSLKRKV